jgi:carbonic anhydrase
LLSNNKVWAEGCVKENPNYFQKLAQIQNPQYLWIGCSDARVPANSIVGLNPGEIFVHRNIANQIMPSDLNALSVIQFAVEFLRVTDIIVCGHYGCGGVKGAFEDEKLGLIDGWLKPIKELSVRNKAALEKIAELDKRLNRLSELNVHQQVLNVCGTKSVQEAWKAGRLLSVHGLIYDLHDGFLKKLDLCISSQEDVKRIS